MERIELLMGEKARKVFWLRILLTNVLKKVNKNRHKILTLLKLSVILILSIMSRRVFPNLIGYFCLSTIIPEVACIRENIGAFLLERQTQLPV